MNTLRTITWQSSPGLIGFGLLILLITAALGLISWRRSQYRRSVGLLELVRVALVASSLLLLNQPEWTETFQPSDKPVVVVLTDESPSMRTRDVRDAQGNPVDRATALSELQREQTWQSLQDRFTIVRQPITAGAGEQGTNLFNALNQTLQQHGLLAGVVLASDGDWTDGPPPIEAATQLRLRNVPVFGVPVGSSTKLPDLELVGFDVPTFGVAGKAVRIPFTVESSLPRTQRVTAVLKASDGSEEKKEVDVAPMSRTSDWFIWNPQSEGDFQLTLSLPPVAEESLLDNNERTAPISIRKEQLRVLVVESYPRWEYRYLRNALSRDPGVDVSCLLFHPGLPKVGGGNRDYISAFPDTIEQLAEYDVVFLGDVGVSQDQLTPQQCELLQGLVEHQASGLVLMPGYQGRQASLTDSALEALFPVVLDPAQPEGWGSRTPNHFELTDAGRRSLLTKLADTYDDNLEVWGNLPGFQWYAPVLRAKAGAEVLCVHESMSNQYGRLPLLVTRTFGAGKVLFMGTDGAWRWRKGVEDLYHYRFWGQVVRWMAYQRNMAKGESMRLYYAPEQPQLGQTVTLTANVMRDSGEPLSEGEVIARIVAPSGMAKSVRLNPVGQQWGEYVGRYATSEPGKHTVTLSSKEVADVLTTSLFIQGELGERPGQPARPEVLEEISRVTRGKTVAVDRLEEVVGALAALPELPLAQRHVHLWSHPLVAGVLVVLMSLFWIGRKAVGLF